MPEHVFRKHFAFMRLHPPGDSVKFLQGVGGTISVRGQVQFLVSYGTRSFIDYFVVADCGTDVLIGSRARAALGLSLGGLGPPSGNFLPAATVGRGDTPKDADLANLFDV